MTQLSSVQRAQLLEELEVETGVDGDKLEAMFRDQIIRELEDDEEFVQSRAKDSKMAKISAEEKEDSLNTESLNPYEALLLGNNNRKQGGSMKQDMTGSRVNQTPLYSPEPATEKGTMRTDTNLETVTETLTPNTFKLAQPDSGQPTL